MDDSRYTSQFSGCKYLTFLLVPISRRPGRRLCRGFLDSRARTPDQVLETEESLWVGTPPSMDYEDNLIRFESESPLPRPRRRAAKKEPDSQQPDLMSDDDQVSETEQPMATAQGAPPFSPLLLRFAINDVDWRSGAVQSVAGIKEVTAVAETESDEERNEGVDGVMMDGGNVPGQLSDKRTLPEKLVNPCAESSPSQPRKAAPVVAPIAAAAPLRQVLNEEGRVGMYASAVFLLVGALWIMLELMVGR